MPNKDSLPILLFLHGFRGNHLGLEETIEYFKSKGFLCYSPDIPPAFNTQDEKLPKIVRFDSDSYADWVADYIEMHKIKCPILIGHSMGSIIAATVAEKYPQKIGNKIFFVSPIATKPPIIIRKLIPLIFFIPNKIISYCTTRFLITPKNPQTFKKILARTNECAKRFTSKKQVYLASKFSVSSTISDFNFRQQVFFIIGSEDKLNSPSQVEQVAQKYHSVTDIVENTGHLINYEYPLILARKILFYLQEK